MTVTILVGFVVALVSMLAGFWVGAAATRAHGARLAATPPPDGWAARCSACGNPAGYSVTWAPSVQAMRKDLRDKVRFDLALTFQNPQRAPQAAPTATEVAPTAGDAS